MDVGLGNGKLDTLVLADRTTKDVALPCSLRCSLHKPAAIANTLGSDENALGVHAIQDVAEAEPLFANEILCRHLHVLEEQFVGLVVDHDTNRLHGESVTERCMQVHEEDRKPLGLLLDLVEWSGPGKQNHQIGVLHTRDVDLLAVDNVAVALAYRRCCNTRGIRSCFRFSHSKCLQTQLTTGNFRQIGLLLRLGTMPQECSHRVHLRVVGPGIAT